MMNFKKTFAKIANAGLSRKDVAELCNVAPRMARLTVGLFCGRLDFLGEHWRAFRYTPGIIETLDGKHFRAVRINRSYCAVKDELRRI